jgi:hypothetical protein
MPLDQAVVARYPQAINLLASGGWFSLAVRLWLDANPRRRGYLPTVAVLFLVSSRRAPARRGGGQAGILRVLQGGVQLLGADRQAQGGEVGEHLLTTMRESRGCFGMR